MNELEVSIVFPAEEKRDLSENEKLIHKVFGLAESQDPRELYKMIQLKHKNITLISGYSGSGKSSLLKAIGNSFLDTKTPQKFDDVEKIVIECFQGNLSDVINWLSRFGLGEARVMVTKVKHLSVGQNERLVLAKLMWDKPSVVVIDEFLAGLDRLTARAIAFQFQKIVRKLNIKCFLATAHSDLTDALFPDTLVNMDFEGECSITYPEFSEKILPEVKQIVVSGGSVDDYIKLKRFHYMDHQIGDISTLTKDVIAVTKAEFNGKVIGVRVITKVFPTSFEKIKFFEVLNKQSALSSRVIVHPTFRGLGVSKLLDSSESLTGNYKKIFTHSALARYFPFNTATGYERLTHVSENKSNLQEKFEEAVQRLTTEPVDKLNDPGFCFTFWNSLSRDDQTRLWSMAQEALSDYDTRYAIYIAENLGVQVAPSNQEILHRFYTKRLQAVSLEKAWQHLSEALYFPMQGMAKTL